jgi:hypothetical protein
MSARSVSILNTPILSQKEVVDKLAMLKGRGITLYIPD